MSETTYINLLKVAKQFLQGKSYRPMSKNELGQKLCIHAQHQKLFGRILRQLQNEGVITKIEGRYYLPESPYETVTGILHMHPRGFGFLQPDHPALVPQDIFIPKQFTQNAVHGDRVEVLIEQGAASDKGPEGKVIAILERGRTHLAGTICSYDRKNALIHAYVPLLGNSQEVIVEPTDEFSVKIGDRMVFEVTDWGGSDRVVYTRISHKIGHISDPSCDIPAAIEEFALLADFRMKVLKEARRIGTRVPLAEISQRKDFRGEVCVTIDPETAKDFDDALSLMKDRQGNYQLSVHIADVTHYVKDKSALDEAAQIRCNSTYLPGTSLPMLPRELSENLCSLKPGVNRLTASVIIKLDPEGKVINYHIVKGVIRSAKRFTYGQVREVLQGKRKSIHKPLLELMEELCGILKARRRERGSVELDMPELILSLDQQGMPTKTRLEMYDVTHQMVEEFMLKANEVVARHLSEAGRLIPYRIHEPPDEDNLIDFSKLVKSFGFHLPAKPKPEEIQQFFVEAQGSPFYGYLASCYIRSMKMATYSPDNIGHYGLSLTHYCHFTSPIRRYADVLVHRALFEEVIEEEKLQILARNCSEQERLSARAENHVRLLKKLRLLKSRHEIDPHENHKGIITKIKPFGFFFEMIELQMEGFIHISKIGDDYYEFDDRQNRLFGTRSGQVFRPGDSIDVSLIDVDLITLESFWELLPDENFTPVKRKPNRRQGPYRQTREL